jgi:uncharacterized membrane protein
VNQLYLLLLTPHVWYLRGMNRRTLLHLFLALVASIALIISVLTLDIHIRLRLDPGYHSPLCQVSETVNCTKVFQSAWAEFLGVPMGSYGVMFYGGLLFLVLLNWRSREKEGWANALLFLTTLGIFASFILFCISKFGIHAFCPLCVATYAASFLLFAGAYLLKRKEGVGSRLSGGFCSLWQWIKAVAGAADEPTVHKSRWSLLLLLLLILGSLALDSALSHWRSTQMGALIVAQWEAQPTAQIPLTAAGSNVD